LNAFSAASTWVDVPGSVEMSATQGLEDNRFYKQAVSVAVDRFDKAVVEWKSASPEDKPVYKELLDAAKEFLKEANKNLMLFLEAPNKNLNAFQPGQKIVHTASPLTSTQKHTHGLSPHHHSETHTRPLPSPPPRNTNTRPPPRTTTQKHTRHSSPSQMQASSLSAPSSREKSSFQFKNTAGAVSNGRLSIGKRS
jgi:hypothetical protein